MCRYLGFEETLEEVFNPMAELSKILSGPLAKIKICGYENNRIMDDRISFGKDY